MVSGWKVVVNMFKLAKRASRPRPASCDVTSLSSLNSSRPIAEGRSLGRKVNYSAIMSKKTDLKPVNTSSLMYGVKILT